MHDAVLADIDDLSAYDIYMSGPPPMIEAARADFLGKGLPVEQLYSDSFEYSTDTLQALKQEQQHDI
ncbi:MAG: hypothetical protein R3E95_15330 [Thiolinea sp.]